MDTATQTEAGVERMEGKENGVLMEYENISGLIEELDKVRESVRRCDNSTDAPLVIFASKVGTKLSELDTPAKTLYT